MEIGMIITMILSGIIAFAFVFGLRKIARNFIRGESDCCGSGGCSGCSGHCGAMPREKESLAVKEIR